MHEIAKIAYEAWCKKLLMQHPVPFAELSKFAQAAWLAVGKAVLANSALDEQRDTSPHTLVKT